MAIYDIDGNEIGIGGGSGFEILEYFENEMQDTIAKVRDCITEPAVVFPVVTDIHRYISKVQTFDRMIANIAVFCESVKCDFVANLGDTIEGDEEQETSMGYADEAMELFHKIGVPLLYAQGNHDNNPYAIGGDSFSGREFNMAQVFRAWFSVTRPDNYNFSENGTDYYVDITGAGVRVVVLNACNVKLARNYAYGSTTATWLTNEAFNTDSTVLLLQHLSSLANQVGRNKHGTNADAITAAIQSFVDGGGKLVQINGHNHVDITYVSPWPEVQMACQKFEHANISSATYQTITGYVDMFSPEREANTHTEDLWTVCVMKPQSKEIDCIRFGAGPDRYLHYDTIAPTTVLSKLSGVTWSSSDTSVATVSNGVISAVGSGTCGILARDASGNFECWIVKVS